MIIDFHAHMASRKVFPNYFLEGIVEELISNDFNPGKPDMARMFVNNMLNKTLIDESCSNLKKQMEEANIDKTVILIADLAYGRESEGLSIDEIYNLHRKVLIDAPDQFVVFAGIDPRRGVKGMDLFQKGICEYGFKGLKLYPPCGFDLDGECVIPYIEMCSKHRIPVLTHTGPSLKGMYNKYNYVNSIKKLAKSFKDVAFIIAHGTYSDFEQNVALALEMDNIYLDISAFQNELNQKQLIGKLKVLGRKVPDKILFGTDWPLYLLSGKQKRWVDFIIASGAFNEGDLEKLFYKNANDVLMDVK